MLEYVEYIKEFVLLCKFLLKGMDWTEKLRVYYYSAFIVEFEYFLNEIIELYFLLLFLF